MAETPQPFQPFVPAHDEVRRLFRELIHQPWGNQQEPTSSLWQPAVDICEDAGAIIVEVELPGLKREDIHIEVEGDTLHLSGERHATAARQGRNYYRLEQHYGRFSRQLRLPGSVDREAIEASFNDGVLTIMLPKKEQA